MVCSALLGRLFARADVLWGLLGGFLLLELDEFANLLVQRLTIKIHRLDTALWAEKYVGWQMANLHALDNTSLPSFEIVGLTPCHRVFSDVSSPAPCVQACSGKPPS